jgi:hypothetical protein
MRFLIILLVWPRLIAAFTDPDLGLVSILEFENTIHSIFLPLSSREVLLLAAGLFHALHQTLSEVTET